MNNAGYAALQIIPTMKGARAALTEEMSQSLGGAASTASTAGQKAGSGFASGFRGAISAVGAAVGTAVVAGTVAIGAFGVAAVKAGIDFNTLGQTSRAALTTLLGSSKAANEQMSALDEFARSSPFAKQVFISAQQQLIGFGVAADKVLPTLDAIQNAVAATGGSNQDISEIANVLAQVTSTGKITAETLNQLGGRGIDAAALIGESLGKSGDQIRESISKGTLDAGLAMDALTEGMATKFAGAAAGVKNTWVGATDRIKGATRDIGGALVAPFIDPKGGGYAVTWANQLADILRSAIPAVTALGKSLGDKIGPAITGLLDKVKELTAGFDLSSLTSGFSGIAAAIAPLAGLFVGLAGPLLKDLPVVGKLFSGLTGPIGLVIGLIGGMLAASPELRAALGGAFQQIGKVLQGLTPVFNVLMDVATQLLGILGDVFADLITSLLPPLMGIIQAVLPIIASLASVIGGVLVQAVTLLAPVLVSIGEALGGVLATILPVIQPLLAALAQIFVQLLAAVMPLIPPLLGIVMAIIPLLDPIGQLVAALLPPLLALFQAIMTPILALIPILVDLLVPAIEFISMVLETLVGWITTALLWLTDLVTGSGDARDQLSDIWNSVLEFFTTVFTAIGDFFVAVWNGIVEFFTGIGEWFTKTVPEWWQDVLDSTTEKWNSLVTFLKTLWQAVKQTASDTWNGIVDFFKGIPQKIFDGIAKVGELGSKFAAWVGDVLESVSDGFGDVIGFVADIPGKIWDALGDLGTLLWDAGSRIISGLLDGITSKFNDVKDFVGGIGSWISDHKGPKAYDLALLVPAGGWIMTGLQKGIKAEMPALARTLTGVADTIASTELPDLSVGVGVDRRGLGVNGTYLTDANDLTADAEPGSTRGGVNVTQHIYYPVAEPTSASVDKAARTLAAVGSL